MVRFIIGQPAQTTALQTAFTFQYGQIYYNTVLGAKNYKLQNLHSNMVRFIIKIVYWIRDSQAHLHSNMVRFIIIC